MAPKKDLKPANWEVAWDGRSRKWYYQDRANGVASWSRPLGCPESLTLPVEEPKAPEAPTGLPPGWEAAYDPVHERYYYYNRETEERTWKRPPATGTAAPTATATFGATATAPGVDTRGVDTRGPPPAASAFLRPDPARDASTNPSMTTQSPSASSSIARDRSAGRGRDEQNRSGGADPSAEWNAEEFLLRLMEAKGTGEKWKMKSVLKEVAESNYALSRSYWRPAPRTLAVPYSATQRTRVPGTGRDPQITFSRMTTADACFYYVAAQPRAVVCALNFANGSQIGGGYKNGAIAQEEDLCRRFPQLYTSLFNASREGLYPFGPPTCRSPDKPEKYSDVLFTRDLILARRGEEEGFALLDPAMQKKVSMVTAAAPNLTGRDIYDRNLLYQTVKSIFIAPRMHQEQINTLILGAWGCGVFGGDPRDISQLFVDAIQKDRLGRLYTEIHFAVPSFSAEDNNTKVFLETLRRAGIAYTEIDPASR